VEAPGRHGPGAGGDGKPVDENKGQGHPVAVAEGHEAYGDGVEDAGIAIGVAVHVVAGVHGGEGKEIGELAVVAAELVAEVGIGPDIGADVALLDVVLAYPDEAAQVLVVIEEYVEDKEVAEQSGSGHQLCILNVEF